MFISCLGLQNWIMKILVPKHKKSVAVTKHLSNVIMKKQTEI